MSLPSQVTTGTMAYTVDNSRWPLVVVRPTEAVSNESALDATYAAFTQLLKQPERFALLYDLRGAASSPARRRRLLDWLEEHRHELVEHLVGMALIVRTGMERGFVTATLWLKPAPFPLQVFTSEAEAEDWLRAAHPNMF